VARGALWTALALASFFIADNLLFRTGWYTQYLEPHSSAGSLESELHWLKYAPSLRHAPEILVAGDSRVAEGFSSRAADAAVDRRLHFWNAGLPGTTPRVWYYFLRAADPTHRRFAAIVIALDSYSDADWFTEFEDRTADQNYLVMRLGFGDCVNFALSMRSVDATQHAIFGCLFRGMILRDDVQAFLAHPENRIASTADWLENGLLYTNGYAGHAETLTGMTVNWGDRAITFPNDVGANLRASVTTFVLRKPLPQTGSLARYRRKWLGGILNLYRDSPTRLIFVQLPRGPAVDPNTGVAAAPPLPESSSHVSVLPADTFTDLEHPQWFFDGLHLNRDGRQNFSARLAPQVEALLAKGGAH
jgi:hypothetical protein